MTAGDTTGVTGANRGQLGARPQPGTTGVTGATGVHKTQWPGAPVTSVSNPSPGPRLTHPRQEPRP